MNQCIRCLEPQDPTEFHHDAESVSELLTNAGIAHKPHDIVCTHCEQTMAMEAEESNRAKWLEEATKSGDDCESNEQALQALREEEERVAD